MGSHDNPSPVWAAPLAAPRRFGPSKRALLQRRAALLALAVVLFVCLVLLLRGWGPRFLHWQLAQGLGAAALAAWFWREGSKRLLEPLSVRELKLHSHALELGRGDFRRLVVFNTLRHIHAVQAKGGGRFISLRLDTDEASVGLRDLEGLSEAFAELAAKKPEHCLIEIEERAVDWGEPLPWLFVIGAVVLLGVLGWRLV